MAATFPFTGSSNPESPGLTWSIPGLKEDPSMCLRCRSAQLLCGKPVCPLLLKYNAFARTLPMVQGRSLDGSTPPAIFVGRSGWPYVTVGPLMSPTHGDTLIFDTPEQWVGRSVEEIVGFRTNLVRGTLPIKVTDAEKGTRQIEDLQLVTMSEGSAESEAHFRRAPRAHLEMSDETPPFGPSAPLEGFRAEVRRVDQRLEKATSDIHCNARTAVDELYAKNVLVSRIQRTFSAGTLGRRGRRRFVPTRWSITAVDDILSKTNLERVRHLQELSEWLVYPLEAIGNRWLLVLLPGAWRYESIEAWFPGTLWNPSAETIMIGDHEGHDGRTTYASIGGCYYAARLASSEHLLRIQRQAGVAILRETHPNSLMPLGVWNVREHVRAAFQRPPERYATWEEVLQRVGTAFTIPAGRWLRQSSLLSSWKTQRRLEEYA